MYTIYSYNLLLSDYQVEITYGIEEANYMGRRLEGECSKWGLTFNEDKVENMNIGHS